MFDITQRGLRAMINGDMQGTRSYKGCFTNHAIDATNG